MQADHHTLTKFGSASRDHVEVCEEGMSCLCFVSSPLSLYRFSLPICSRLCSMCESMCVGHTQQHGVCVCVWCGVIQYSEVMLVIWQRRRCRVEEEQQGRLPRCCIIQGHAFILYALQIYGTLDNCSHLLPRGNVLGDVRERTGTYRCHFLCRLSPTPVIGWLSVEGRDLNHWNGRRMLT